MNRIPLCIIIVLILSGLTACGSGPGEFADPAPAEAAPGAAALGEPNEEDAGEILEEILENLPGPGEALPVSEFGEIWGYVLADHEQDLKTAYPLSDVGYFAAEVDVYGKLTKAPDRQKLAFFPGRVHLVVICHNTALTHFILAEGSAERKALIADLLAAARNFDGLQVDFENVPPKDGAAFLSFLKELRAGLKDKMFTIALYARTRPIKNDVYDYQAIKPLVDRILVMAYDEHWSGSGPGPIASMTWCRRVAAYAQEIIGKEKLIMGLPFYGRTWGTVNPSRAYIHSGIEKIKKDQGVTRVQRENGIPTFKYELSVPVTAYYEDEYSLAIRMEMYQKMGIPAIGFWRIGQETQAVWDLLKLKQGGK